jgi:hypothetical protein
MTARGDKSKSALRQCLQRLEGLVETLDRIDDADARTAAQALLETMLDLHGLALARILTLCHGARDEGALMAGLIEDDYVAAVMLLHGLHPVDPETRLRNKLAEMRSHWGARGVRADIVDVDRSSARVRVMRTNDETLPDIELLKQELEDSLTEAAPDLDEIAIEWPAAFSALTRSTGQIALADLLDRGGDQHDGPRA